MATPKARRATCKRKITRFENFLNEEIVAERRLNQIPERLIKLEEVYLEFENTFVDDDEIVAVDDSAEAVAAAAEANRAAQMAAERELAEFENKYYLLVCRAKELIAPPPVNQNQVNPLGRARSNTPEVPAQFQAKVSLPQLLIPSFSGEYDQWQSFHDTFASLIHNETAITNVQKFHYLQRALVGNAAKIIERIPPTDANYEVAWNLLKTRCGNKKSIIKTHIKNILEVHQISKQSYNALGNFVDTLENNVKALENLGIPVHSWNAILLYILVEKLDPFTKEKWETLMHKEESPTVIAFVEFLRERCTILESLVNVSAKPEANKFRSEANKSNDRERRVHAHVATDAVKCVYCQGNHQIYACQGFKDLPVSNRISEVTKLSLCFNCLKRDHVAQRCKSGACRVCKGKHNTLLHRGENTAINDNRNNAKHSVSMPALLPTTDNSDAVATNSSIAANAVTSGGEYDFDQIVLLSTAIVNILDNNGTVIKCRALLDSGSQSSFMTSELLSRLQLGHSKVRIPVLGISAVNANTITKVTRATIRSIHSEYETSMSFLVINKITERVPQRNICRDRLQLPNQLELADPSFDRVGNIDILLGVNVFYELLLGNQIRLGERDTLILQESKLGWIVSGSVFEKRHNTRTSCNLVQANQQDIQTQLEAFWRVEEVNGDSRARWSSEETACEQHFVNTAKRDSNGRFIVSLPLRDNFATLGNSRDIAVRRFQALENKFRKDENLKQSYTHFMNEYLSLGHMSLVSNEPVAGPSCYLPHHCVQKEESLTTKLRVVFDASASTSSGVSLNEVLMVGPSIQEDIFSILVRFRMHNIVYTADIEKMYRQVQMNQEHINLQRIVWRNEPAEQLSHYTLNTITYGTAPASFLATRCLKQLGFENELTYPQASQAIHSDFYMDDFISGSTDIESAKLIINQVDSILKSGGFVLRQWATNSSEVLDNLSLGSPNSRYAIKGESSKTLGVFWQSDRDNLRYKIKSTQIGRVTKRTMLSIVSQVFDPLGLVGPVIVKAKILLQKLWQCNLSWDEDIPKHLLFEWEQFYENLSVLEDLRVSRHVLLERFESVEIHCFCDASQVAYGACVYAVSRNSNQVLVRLITAKSRVAPLKVVTLPRLELCAALLAAELSEQVKGALKTSVNKFYFWSDSTVTLSWLASEPNRFKTFVANRISRIQTLTDKHSWRYVPTLLNPADAISRGLNPNQLSSHELWWNGPEFLRGGSDRWPAIPIMNTETVLEVKKGVVLCNKTVIDCDIINRYSSYNKLLRVVAYLYRFFDNSKKFAVRRLGNLSVDELEHSKLVLSKVVQAQHFRAELLALKAGKAVSKNSKLVALDPFVDSNGLLRVGGRLRNSQLPYTIKHPIILPSGGHFVILIVRHEHYLNLHAGTQAVLSAIRAQFWPLSGKRTVRNVLRKCVVCFRAKPTELSQKMADLPINRVIIGRPFLNVGVDYGGPYQIKDSKFRNKKYIKAYICIFSCFSTRAIHIELVSDLTTDGFLNAFKRFVARRGLCANVYSDNATNFVGADRRLQEIAKLQHETEFQKYSLESKIRWHFIPPRSPHFGGLWESAIRQAKSHLTRVLSSVMLTFEEFYTLLTQIEAIINSRPLIPLTEEADSLDILTPGHFLIGSALNSVPEPMVAEERATYVHRYKHVQLLTQQFWKKWSNDYLHTLQQRTKWRFEQTGVVENSLVLIEEDNQPPLCWKMGRIVSVHPGKDGKVRVVSIKTATDVIKRAVAKVCLLPTDAEVSRATVCD